MNTHHSYVGNRIISRLKELGKSQVVLCHETGLSTTAVSAYCTGKRVPETTALYQIAKALKTSMEWILVGEITTNEDITNEDIRPVLPLCDSSPLNEMEADLVAMFRLLSEGQQDEVFDLLYFKYKRHIEDKKGSISSTYRNENKQQKSDLDKQQKSCGEIA
ncbi:helix-turn-helix domain-containing protein [Hungatella effluvii]|uniref:helix-turn-helix domain-containing protein n=1 Tax=Hungatella effluvii TaxID=1096246 RepID=UPI0022E8802C|nr:helix-turn-helix domain-containing protein [Hungatella effluvii]